MRTLLNPKDHDGEDLIGVVVATGGALPTFTQSTNVPPDIDKNERTITPRPMPHVIYSPADLAHNGVGLPASGTTAISAVANMGAVTKSTLYVNCTQAADVYLNTYQEDGATIGGTYKFVFGAAGERVANLYRVGIGSEFNRWHPDKCSSAIARVQL